MSSLKNTATANTRLHLVITNREINDVNAHTTVIHLNQDWDSPNLAKSFLENAVKDELEVLNDCRLYNISESVVMRFVAKPVGDNEYIIRDKTLHNAFVASYALHECETKNSRDGRLRWFYRGYIVNTNSRKNRFCVTKGDDKLTVRNSLTAALSYIDSLVSTYI